MNLNELRDKAYSNACAKGFHDKEYSNEHWLMLVITELSEAIEADRKGERADISNITELTTEDLLIDWKVERFKAEYEVYVKGSVEEELADAVIRLLDLAGLRGIDLNDRFIISYIVSDKKTLTENCYTIIKDIVNYKYSFEECLNYSIRQIIELAKISNIDLLWHIEQKMKYNETREPLHGKDY